MNSGKAVMRLTGHSALYWYLGTLHGLAAQSSSASTSTLLKMAPIIMKEKINEFLAAGNDIAIPILSLVKDASGAFPPLQLAATGALFIMTYVKVSSV